MRFPFSSLELRVAALAVSFAATAAALFFFSLTPANAAGEDVRRLSAEIAVLNADARRMAAKGLSPQHRRGVQARLRGGLAVLPLLLRAAENDDAALPGLEEGRVGQILSALDAGDGTALIDALSVLGAAYRFDTSGLLPPDNRPQALSRAKRLHEAYCAACHDDPDLKVSRPAWNLFGLARKIPPAELAARLVIGVRGDSLTGLDNPLRNAEISALIAFYRKDTAAGN